MGTAPLVASEGRARTKRFLDDERPETPCVVIDLDVVHDSYRALAAALPRVDIFYAVKANPARPILELLVDQGSGFDVASPAEVDACLAAGASPDRMSYGNTTKRRSWIGEAYDKGIRLFTVDSGEELAKVVAVAAGETVMCRLGCAGAGADWPLSRKFGCNVPAAIEILRAAGGAGMRLGVSFHVGSQQRDVHAWDEALQRVAEVRRALRRDGLELDVVNLGGGFPGRYVQHVPSTWSYGAAIDAAVRRHLGPRPPRLIAEPGRSLVADAGVIEAEVLLVTRRSERADERWVTLDIGMFGGLAEVMGEAIRYRICTAHDGGPTGPVVLAGPTCDSADVLYEDYRYELPLALAEGDRVRLLSAGAYTTTYASVGFNGFSPPDAHYLPRTR
jgi:ornithine decarboxylase